MAQIRRGLVSGPSKREPPASYLYQSPIDSLRNRTSGAVEGRTPKPRLYSYEYQVPPLHCIELEECTVNAHAPFPTIQK